MREAAEALKLTAPELLKKKAVERVIEEKDFSDGYFAALKSDIAEFFKKKAAVPVEQLVAERYKRFRAF